MLLCSVIFLTLSFANMVRTATLRKERTEFVELTNGDYLNAFIDESPYKLRIATLTRGNSTEAPIIAVLNELHHRKQFEAIFSYDGYLENCQISSDPESQKDFVDSFDESVDNHHLKSQKSFGGENRLAIPKMSAFLPENLQYLVDDGMDLASVADKLELECNNFASKMKLQIKLATRRGIHRLDSIHHHHNHPNTQVKRSGRGKRGIIAGKYRKYMIWPNTKWCGHGTLAEHPEDFGKNKGLDMCCKEHDHCPLHINGLSSRLNYDNWSPFTINDCKCDIKFRDCLQAQMDSNTGFAGAYNMGRFFFNLANPRCFDMKMKNVCVRRSWWGSCIREECQMSAVTRSIEHRFKEKDD